jgi:DNA polymerase-3 subunit alpha
LENTYGVIVYQEQVMQIVQSVGGFSLGGADLVRRAMGKKIKEEMDKLKGQFADGAVAKRFYKSLCRRAF